MSRPRQNARRRRPSMESSSSESSFPEAEIYDEEDSMMQHPNDSQSSLGVSLKDMELDAVEFEERCRISPISRLPAELLMSVFSKLSSNADLKNCMLVSKLWARNSVDLLWHRPATSRWENLISIIQTARKRDGYFAYHDLIKRLNLAQLSDKVSDGTLKPLAGCKRIERLTLTNCEKLTDMSVAPLIEGNRNLLAVDVTALVEITDRTMLAIANYCYKLQGLNISRCSKITDESLFEIAKKCRRVKRLKFNECAQLTDYSITAFADYCPDLLEVDLHNCEALTDVSATALIAKCRQLREFRLAHCTNITDDAFLRLPSDTYYESLRILDLTDCNELQDAGLLKIVTVAPRLRNLVLAKCRRITDRGVMAITRLGKNLHFIHLGHCSQITDYGVSHLIRFCTRIRYIDLACCSELTDESVKMLAALPKLKRIGLVKCGNITDASIEALALAQMKVGTMLPFQNWQNSLERLHLSYCANLTIKSIRLLLLNCPRLTHLSLTGVHDFLQEDLLAFCREAPPEFNDHQRDVFCVFSGPGVAQLRRHLSRHYSADGTPMSEPIIDYLEQAQQLDLESNQGVQSILDMAMRNNAETAASLALTATPPAPDFRNLSAGATPENRTNNTGGAGEGAGSGVPPLPPPPPPEHIPSVGAAAVPPSLTAANAQSPAGGRVPSPTIHATPHTISFLPTRHLHHSHTHTHTHNHAHAHHNIPHHHPLRQPQQNHYNLQQQSQRQNNHNSNNAAAPGENLSTVPLPSIVPESPPPALQQPLSGSTAAAGASQDLTMLDLPPIDAAGSGRGAGGAIGSSGVIGGYSHVHAQTGASSRSGTGASEGAQSRPRSFSMS